MPYLLLIIIFLGVTFSGAAFGAGNIHTTRPKLYAFELDGIKRARLEAALASVKFGDSLQVVKNKMGKPDSENSVYRPQLFGKNIFVFTRLDYDLKKVNLHTDNEFDWKITFYFNEMGTLYAIDRASKNR